MQTNGQDLWIIIRNLLRIDHFLGFCNILWFHGIFEPRVLPLKGGQFEFETVASIDDTISKFICTGLEIDKSINLTLKQRYKSIH